MSIPPSFNPSIRHPVSSLSSFTLASNLTVRVGSSAQNPPSAPSSSMLVQAQEELREGCDLCTLPPLLDFLLGASPLLGEVLPESSSPAGLLDDADFRRLGLGRPPSLSEKEGRALLPGEDFRRDLPSVEEDMCEDGERIAVGQGISSSVEVMPECCGCIFISASRRESALLRADLGGPAAAIVAAVSLELSLALVLLTLAW